MLLSCWKVECFPSLSSRSTMSSRNRAQLLVMNHRTWQVQPLVILEHLCALSVLLDNCQWKMIYHWYTKYPWNGIPRVVTALSSSTCLNLSSSHRATCHLGHMSELSNFSPTLVFYITRDTTEEIERSKENIIILISVLLCGRAICSALKNNGPLCKWNFCNDRWSNRNQCGSKFSFPNK